MMISRFKYLYHIDSAAALAGKRDDVQISIVNAIAQKKRQETTTRTTPHRSQFLDIAFLHRFGAARDL
jgi:hypothetical protein